MKIIYKDVFFKIVCLKIDKRKLNRMNRMIDKQKLEI